MDRWAHLAHLDPLAQWEHQVGLLKPCSDQKLLTIRIIMFSLSLKLELCTKSHFVMFWACGGFKTRMLHTFCMKQISTQRWRDLVVCVFLCVCISALKCVHLSTAGWFLSADLGVFSCSPFSWSHDHHLHNFFFCFLRFDYHWYRIPWFQWTKGRLRSSRIRYSRCARR